MSIEITKKYPVQIMCWMIGIIALIIPIIMKSLDILEFGWTISLLFPFMILLMYKSWRYVIPSLLVVTALKFFVEYQINAIMFIHSFAEVLLNTIANWILFLTITYFFLRYVKTSTQLSESEERYRKVVEFSPKGIVIHKDGEVLYANPKALDIVKVDDPQGESIYSFLHHDFQKVSKERIAKTKKGEELPFHETKLTRKDGQEIDVEIITVSVPFNGVSANLTMFRDITDRKKVECELVKSEKEYRKLIEFLPEPILIHRHGIIQYANSASIELLGATKLERLEGKSILDFSPPEYIDMVKDRITHLNQPGMLIAPTEEKVICLDHSIRDVEVSGISIKYGGELSYLMVIHDLTERKQAEKALIESGERYRLIAENMKDLVCIIAEDGTFKYASPSHVAVLGLPGESYEGNQAIDWMYPDDIEGVKKTLKEIVQSSEEKIFNFRFKNIEGDWVWLEGKGTPIYDMNGTFKHYLVVSREITERKMYEEKLTHMAYHDTLTGLPNRRFFNERLKQSLKEAIRYERKMAVMFMDLDKFKNINDTLGHDVGDELLKQFAKRVKGCIRESDIIGRQGGDEFTVLLPEIQEEEDAIQIAMRILASFQEPWRIGSHIFYTTSSIGVSFYPKNGTTAHDLIKSADMALYEAKESGRNNIKIADLK